MATLTEWQSQTGRWNSAASWTDGIPDGTKDARLGRLSQADVRLGHTGALCRRLITTRDYRGKLGTGVSNPVEIDVNEMAILRGRGQHFVKFIAGSFTPVVLDSPNLANAGTLDGELGRVAVKSGNWITAATAELVFQIYVGGPDASLLVEPRKAGTEAMAPFVVCESGLLDNHRDSGVNDFFMCCIGGHLIQRGKLTDGDKVCRGAGGKFQYLPLVDPGVGGANDAEWILAGGLSDFQDADFNFGVSKLIIGTGAEVLGSQLQPGGLPLALSAVMDLREDYP